MVTDVLKCPQMSAILNFPTKPSFPRWNVTPAQAGAGIHRAAAALTNRPSEECQHHEK